MSISILADARSGWIYTRTEDNGSRFTLGRIGDLAEKTLACFGINSSTASPDRLDPTVNKVSVLAKANGYFNWVMLNVYPMRQTDPNGLPGDPDAELVDTNLSEIRRVVGKYHPDILFAYGNLIGKRKYLRECLKGIIGILKSMGYDDVLIIKLTKSGNPVHPLYQPKNSKFEKVLLDDLLVRLGSD